MAADDDETVWMPTARNPRDNVVQGAWPGFALPHRPGNKPDLKTRKREVPVSNPIARGADSGGYAAVVGTGVACSKRDESLNICRDAISINLIEHAENVRIKQRLRGEGR